eukprot:TRINITY_DN570_c0_g2_i1.p1 TRINITY_DN570_c0_g2~~TRINITY_DN570_c0_g2_i1.p1  ORF type:complete len:330 (-),score=82.52 TRINITY_DN570_c0_g2_i1:970-1935(-)
MAAFFLGRGSKPVARKTAYTATADPKEAVDDATRKLTAELRRHIRAMAAYPPLTPEWFVMVESLQHIASIALMEQSPAKPGSQATLWDRDEMSVRYLLEEGKLNMCLRALHFHSSLKRELAQNPEILAQKAEELQLSPAVVQNKLDLFEHSMGLLLKCAFDSVESLQTCDLPELIAMCGEVLLAVQLDKSQQAADFDRNQESVVLHYLASLGRHLESLNEDRVMASLAEHNVMGLVVAHVNSNKDVLKQDAIIAACEFLSCAIDTDTFDTRRDQFLNRDQRVQLVKLYIAALAPLADMPDVRKKISALVQLVSRERALLGL